MPKTWSPSQAKKFAKEARLNKPYYVVYDIAQNRAPYEDAQLYSEFTFTRRAPFTGNPMTDGGTSAEGLCLRYGPVYDKPPAGMRNVAGPGPQVGAPLGEDHSAYLDEAELRGMEKLAAQGTDPRARRIRGRRV
ncbi:hypothetical protein [Streptomyces prasinopilosus]|uniref:hypothetical protein n=1 Tax=Streptomyces prasinopilosus TaxID=67344 RepID=UPI0006EB9C70|nr:hypothetical protein [Streptomyces prasinopilosus]